MPIVLLALQARQQYKALRFPIVANAVEQVRATVLRESSFPPIEVVAAAACVDPRRALPIPSRQLSLIASTSCPRPGTWPGVRSVSSPTPRTSAPRAAPLRQRALWSTERSPGADANEPDQRRRPTTHRPGWYPGQETSSSRATPPRVRGHERRPCGHSRTRGEPVERRLRRLGGQACIIAPPPQPGRGLARLAGRRLDRGCHRRHS